MVKTVGLDAGARASASVKAGARPEVVKALRRQAGNSHLSFVVAMPLGVTRSGPWAGGELCARIDVQTRRPLV